MIRRHCILIIFYLLSCVLYSQDRNFFDKAGDKIFLWTLKHQIWQPEFSPDTLKIGDTLTVWSKKGNKKIPNAIRESKNGDIDFLSNHKIKQRLISSNGKTVRREIGTWRFENFRLFLFFPEKNYEIEWIEQNCDLIKGTIIGIYTYRKK